MTQFSENQDCIFCTQSRRMKEDGNDCRNRDNPIKKENRDDDRGESLEVLMQRRSACHWNLNALNAAFEQKTESQMNIASVSEHNDSVKTYMVILNGINQQLTAGSEQEAASLQERVNEQVASLEEGQKHIDAMTNKVEQYQKQLKDLQVKLQEEERKLDDYHQGHLIDAKQLLVDRRDLEKANATVIARRSECAAVNDMAVSHKLVIDEALNGIEQDSNQWTTEDVMSWLKCIGFDEAKYRSLWTTVRKGKLTGSKLNLLSPLCLTAIGLDDKDKKRLLERIGRVRQKGEDGSGNICTFCAERPINTVIVPCGHQSFCFDCSATRNITACPICRGSVTRLLRTYLHGF